MNEQSLAKFLIAIGALFLLLGVFFLFKDRIPGLSRLGRLPGDIYIEKDNMKFYFPLATSILLSIILSLVMWFFRDRPK